MADFYVAATDRMSWGRGTRLWEAIGHAVHHGGLSVKEIQLFHLKCPDGTLESDIYVDGMGQIVGPTGTEATVLPTIKPANRLVETFFSWCDMVNALTEDSDED